MNCCCVQLQTDVNNLSSRSRRIRLLRKAGRCGSVFIPLLLSVCVLAPCAVLRRIVAKINHRGCASLGDNSSSTCSPFLVPQGVQILLNNPSCCMGLLGCRFCCSPLLSPAQLL